MATNKGFLDYLSEEASKRPSRRQRALSRTPTNWVEYIYPSVAAQLRELNAISGNDETPGIRREKGKLIGRLAEYDKFLFSLDPPPKPRTPEEEEADMLVKAPENSESLDSVAPKAGQQRNPSAIVKPTLQTIDADPFHSYLIRKGVQTGRDSFDFRRLKGVLEREPAVQATDESLRGSVYYASIPNLPLEETQKAEKQRLREERETFKAFRSLYNNRLEKSQREAIAGQLERLHLRGPYESNLEAKLAAYNEITHGMSFEEIVKDAKWKPYELDILHEINLRQTDSYHSPLQEVSEGWIGSQYGAPSRTPSVRDTGTDYDHMKPEQYGALRRILYETFDDVETAPDWFKDFTDNVKDIAELSSTEPSKPTRRSSPKPRSTEPERASEEQVASLRLYADQMPELAGIAREAESYSSAEAHSVITDLAKEFHRRISKSQGATIRSHSKSKMKQPAIPRMR